MRSPQRTTDAGSNRARAYKLFVLPLLLIICTLFYYFGELVDWAAWDALRASFFYGVHDIHRLLFLVPIIYAGYTARVRGAIIITLVSLIIFLPRAFFISPYPDPLLRMLLFTIVAGVVGYLVARIRNEQERYRHLQEAVRGERDKMLGIVDGMADGVMITGPDYRIRFMNSSMVRDFGEGTGTTCYEHMHKVSSLSECCQHCKILDVIRSGKVENWKCEFPDGRSYEVVATPYVDTDGVVCQLSIFRNVTRHEK
jgi:PAS domain-containing protein